MQVGIVDFRGLTDFPRPDLASGKAVNKAEALSFLEEYLSQRNARYQRLGDFLGQFGLEFSPDRIGFQNVVRFMAVAKKDTIRQGKIDSVWEHFVWDAALLLGDLVIENSPKRKLFWAVDDRGTGRNGERYWYYFVVSGYSDPHNCIEPDNLIENFLVEHLDRSIEDGSLAFLDTVLNYSAEMQGQEHNTRV